MLTQRAASAMRQKEEVNAGRGAVSRSGGRGGARAASLIGIPGVSDAVKWVEKAAGNLSAALEELSIYVA